MILPEFSTSDEVLEYAARLIEEASFTDLAGIWAKRKRDREDAELRRKTILETRQDCARLIRAFKNRPDLDAKNVLQRLSELRPCDNHVAYLKDAWPLAWKGWLNIKATVTCNSNCVPPETGYQIEITEDGRAVLAESKTP